MDVNGVMPPNSGSNILTTNVCIICLYTVYIIQCKGRDQRCKRPLKHDTVSCKIFYIIFIVDSLFYFNQVYLMTLIWGTYGLISSNRTLSNSGKFLDTFPSFGSPTILGLKRVAASRKTALYGGFVFVLSKWIGIIFMQRSSKSSSPIKVCVEPPKKTQSMAGGVEKAIEFCCENRHGWRHWRREGWDFVDGIQGVIKATHLDKRRRFFTMISGLRSGNVFLLKDVRIPKRSMEECCVFPQHFLSADFFKGDLLKVSVQTCFFLIYDGPNKMWTYQKPKEPEFDLMNPANRCRLGPCQL